MFVYATFDELPRNLSVMKRIEEKIVISFCWKIFCLFILNKNMMIYIYIFSFTEIYKQFNQIFKQF